MLLSRTQQLSQSKLFQPTAQNQPTTFPFLKIHNKIEGLVKNKLWEIDVVHEAAGRGLYIEHMIFCLL